MIEQYVMTEQSIKYGITVLFTIILVIVNSITLKKLLKTLHDLRVISENKFKNTKETNNFIKVIITFGLILIAVNYFVMMGASLVRISILSDSVDKGTIYLLFVVTIGYLITLITFLLFFYIIYNIERENKKDYIPQHEDNKKLGGKSQ